MVLDIVVQFQENSWKAEKKAVIFSLLLFIIIDEL